MADSFDQTSKTRLITLISLKSKGTHSTDIVLSRTTRADASRLQVFFWRSRWKKLRFNILPCGSAVTLHLSLFNNTIPFPPQAQTRPLISWKKEKHMRLNGYPVSCRFRMCSERQASRPMAVLQCYVQVWINSMYTKKWGKIAATCSCSSGYHLAQCMLGEHSNGG